MKRKKARRAVSDNRITREQLDYLVLGYALDSPENRQTADGLMPFDSLSHAEAMYKAHRDEVERHYRKDFKPLMSDEPWDPCWAEERWGGLSRSA